MEDEIDEEKALLDCEDLNGLIHYFFFFIWGVFVIVIFPLEAYHLFIEHQLAVLIFSPLIGILIFLFFFFLFKKYASVSLSRNEKILIVKRLFQKNHFIKVDEIKDLSEVTFFSPQTISFHFIKNGKIEKVTFFPELDSFLFFSSHSTYIRLKELKEKSLKYT